jgi:hypothetical protein
MAAISFPSELFPGYPEISMDCPTGWQPMPDGRVTLAVIKDVPPGQFRPNVVVACSRLHPGQTLEQAIDEVSKTMSELDEYAEIGREQRLISGFPGFRLEGSFSDPSVGILVQAVRLAAIHQGPVTDLLQVTGTCSGAQAEQMWGQIRQIQDSITVRH